MSLNWAEIASAISRELCCGCGILNGLNEAERGVLTFELRRGEQVVAKTETEIRVLARDEWGGLICGGELLAAFVMPNDPAIAKLQKIAGEILAKHGHEPALNGYQSRDPRRAYMLVAALCSAVASRSLTYQMVLENLGWNIVRVWSPDWWYDAKSAIATIDQQCLSC